MNKRIFAECFAPINRFSRLIVWHMKPVLESKAKELMGLAVSTALRCDECILYHLDRSVAEGATRKEIIETLNIALVIGGSIVIPHLRTAFDAMDAIFGNI
ncbi:carboxymuconolactone decarboxylase family protein [bacterium]|nr:carboxymuconolactone decarboxylase family protein [bacterium]